MAKMTRSAQLQSAQHERACRTERQHWPSLRHEPYTARAGICITPAPTDIAAAVADDDGNVVVIHIDSVKVVPPSSPATDHHRIFTGSAIREVRPTG